MLSDAEDVPVSVTTPKQWQVIRSTNVTATFLRVLHKILNTIRKKYLYELHGIYHSTNFEKKNGLKVYTEIYGANYILFHIGSSLHEAHIEHISLTKGLIIKRYYWLIRNIGLIKIYKHSSEWCIFNEIPGQLSHYSD